MDILVTGSNGFVGNGVVRQLRKVHYIIGGGTKRNTLTDVDKYVRWDIGHDDIPDTLLETKVDAVIHAASNKSPQDDDMELSFTNLVGIQRIINLCKMNGCKIAILFSGIPIIGEPENRIIRETDSVNPRTMYHATKAAQELMFRQLERSGIRVIILRIPSPISPIMKGKTIFTIFADTVIKNEDIIINGKGTRRQNYIDIRDIAQACERILKSPNAQGIYNIGSEVTVSNLELAQKCIDIADSQSKIIFSGHPDPTDNQDWQIDISRLQMDTGFRQKFMIEQTIREYIQRKKGDGKK